MRARSSRPRRRSARMYRLAHMQWWATTWSWATDACCEHHAVVQGPAQLGTRKSSVSLLRWWAAIRRILTFQRRERVARSWRRQQFREFCTVNRGTVKGGGVTRLGSHNLIMSYAHIGHDCVVGSHTIFVNGATLAGHVTVEDYAHGGAFVRCINFAALGKYAYIAAHTVITQDVPPFSKIVAPRGTRCYGVNSVGLERAWIFARAD